MSDPDSYLRIRELTKKFGEFVALSNVSLDVTDGEFVCFLGPSGCGKTTLLRAIAGLDIQTYGSVEQAGKDVSDLPPAERDFGIVFQSYALFPNLTVAKNVGYGLENLGQSADKVRARVTELLELVGLPEQGDKHPAQLSGGQQQRVALARAIAISPGLLLLDEPLSALDAKVRVMLRKEVKMLQEKLGITTIMVTHDQEEALTMADRIVVINKGVIEQIGTPEDIYRNPATHFVADFIGSMNFMPARRTEADSVRIGNHSFNLAASASAKEDPVGDVVVAIRPEDVRVGVEDQNSLQVEVVSVEFLGPYVRAELSAPGIGDIRVLADFSANLVRSDGICEGSKVTVCLPAEALRVYPS